MDGGGLTFLGAEVVEPERASRISSEEGFPPSRNDLTPGQPAEGYVAEDDADGRRYGYELRLGYRLDGSEARQSGIRVEYEVGGERHRVLLPSELVVCLGPRGTPCAPDAEPSLSSG